MKLAITGTLKYITAIKCIKFLLWTGAAGDFVDEEPGEVARAVRDATDGNSSAIRVLARTILRAELQARILPGGHCVVLELILLPFVECLICCAIFAVVQSESRRKISRKCLERFS